MGGLKKSADSGNCQRNTRKVAHNMNQEKYTTGSKKRKGWIMALALAVIALAIYAAWTEAGAEGRREPDAVFPMANTNISWSQTFHAGAWGE